MDQQIDSVARMVLALQRVPGIGATTIRRMAAGLGSWGDLATCSPERLAGLAGSIRRRPMAVDHLAAALVEADRVLATCQEHGITVLVAGAASWPDQLHRLDDPPVLLFARGRVDILRRPGIAVVGTRTPTAYGLACARRFALRVVEHGAVVVSGLALGCDGAAHAGALDGRGATVAVLPCPIDQILPASHHHLADRILVDGGCLVGEYAPDPTARVGKHCFIARDRIQAGLARGVIAVETSATGGTLHAVHAAQRAGIPIACLQSRDPVWSAAPGTAGGRALMATGAASPLLGAEDLQRWLDAVGMDAEPASPVLPFTPWKG